ncbi:hypothetical protein DSCA_28700 [Desulfosarcina alkanivorans]|uniref:Uncharacterized protein n=1 Tax=Desulfosarcina alkanivorans TaxID=571177 RepID=A0A5K7YL71_9BACT|nr:hypothetical protein [Desulfosarcina alkanivorans]BBO68940.1 hypothetical protein DSCA_28700 [Desulfosarcina alkanivorans]
MNDEIHRESLLRTWIWLGVMLGIILFKGFLAFTVVSDMGQPTWAYRPVKDVPAQSPYAVYQLLPNPQHVRGAGGE